MHPRENSGYAYELAHPWNKILRAPMCTRSKDFADTLESFLCRCYIKQGGAFVRPSCVMSYLVPDRCGRSHWSSTSSCWYSRRQMNMYEYILRQRLAVDTGRVSLSHTHTHTAMRMQVVA